MTSFERRQSLLELLRKQPGLRVPEMARELGISEGTVRNDLNALEQQGRLTRVHGGAVLNNELQNPNSAFGIHFQERVKEKNCIGQRAAQLVHDGDSILLDASSTVYYFSQNLKDRIRLRVVTNGIDVACLLARNTTNTVVLLGGVVTPYGSSVTGSLSEQIIHDLHVQRAFVSCSGFSLERGLTDVHLEEAELKSKAITSAREVIALVDSSKMGKEDLTSFASIKQITHVFTDSDLNDEWADRLRVAGIPFTVCSTN